MGQARVEREIEKLLQAVDRPGDYCTHGRLFAPLPRVEVAGAGALSFPVPEAQIKDLIAVAARAPYGRGTATLLDRSVRDCWQIDARKVRLAGQGWKDTFARVRTAAAEGLGCPPQRITARLYKLLVYEPGGFFAPHRDTEKTDGMIATLSVSLPTAGAGGELVVRHRGRERVIDMTAAEPSELAFAAFYADCEHEVRPLTEGHRLSLVFNVRLRADDTDTPRTAPDYTAHIDRLAGRLAAWDRTPDAADKLAWVLEHQYSEAGLSLEALKNGDAAVARLLAAAAEQADCALHAAILHLEEWGGAEYSYQGDYWGGDDDVDAEMGEVEDYRQWLDAWTAPDGSRPPFGEIELPPEERLPAGVFDDMEPDEQHVEEATGNAGATVERTYRRAALVLWPRSRTLKVVAGGGIDAAVAWVAGEQARRASGGDERIRKLTAGLIDIWPAHRIDFGELGDREAEGRKRMLRLLRTTGDGEAAARFLREVLLARYDGRENDALARALDTAGMPAARDFLHDMVREHLRRRPAALLDLIWRVDGLHPAGSESAWNDVLRRVVGAILEALPGALPPEPEREEDPWRLQSQRPARFTGTAVFHLFGLAWRRGLADAAAAADAVAAEPKIVTPERTLPAALVKLHAEPGAADGAAYAALWRHAAAALLARSAAPPVAPDDWAIKANTGCDCEPCQALRAFCRDPAARIARFPLNKDLRRHVHRVIDDQRLDIDHVTERRGRPFTLVCTKNRASHKRRLDEYAEDVSRMRALIGANPAGEQAAGCARNLTRLCDAAAASRSA